jgi:two-component system sensor kinase FixL
VFLKINCELAATINDVRIAYKSMNKNEFESSGFDNTKTLWAIFSTAIDGIILINEQGTILMCNYSAEKMFGYTSDEMIGHNVSMLMHSPHKENHDAYLNRYKATGEARIIGIGREVTAIKKSKEIFPLRLAISEIWMDDTRFYAGVLHDISLQKTAEEELFRLTQELESKVQQRTEELGEVVNRLLKLNQQYKHEIAERIDIEAALKRKEAELKSLLNKEIELNQMKSRFVSMASHEFRTPLSTILSSAALIGKYTGKEEQEKREKHITKIRNAVNNLTNILNDFLSLEKLEEGSLQTRIELVRIPAFCSDLVEEMNLLLKEGQRIQLQIEERLEDIHTDPRFLYNALVNILSNAIKYSVENTSIYFRIACDGEYIIFSVQDEGMGIPEDEQKHLFNRFFRARNAINVQGTGLGLHIVKRYMDLLGGYIKFQSKVGKGTRFDLYVPEQCGKQLQTN